MSLPKIAIIGAGPGGLTLACILQNHGMPCTIFELDQDRTFREQGGIIDLHPEGGQRAMREAGLFEAFEKNIVPAGDSMKLIKSDGRVMWDENNTKHAQAGASRDRPEIDRAKLRDILLDSVDPASLVWDRKLVSVEPVASNKYDLHFTNSVEKGFDLVVGGDGAWSKVRPLVTDKMPFYSGISIIELKAASVSTKHQWLSNFTGTGSLFMFDEGRAIVAQQNGSDRIRVYAAVRQPETWVKDCGIDWEQPELARQALVERYFGDCHADLKRAITDPSDGLIPRPLYMLPVGLTWEPRAGVTLLGDAAHLMTPFAGVGVNVTMTDSLCLAEALLKQKDSFKTDLQGSLATAIKEYEVPMFERAKENMEKTWQGLQGHFSAGGIEHRVQRLEGMAKRRAAARAAALEQKSS